MNFNYSYRALLVTSLLFGILFLTLWSIKLSSEIPEDAEAAPVEYIETDPELEEEEEENPIASTSKIETNRAYNEAEKFIRESEQQRLENPLQQENTNEPQLNEERISDATQEAIDAAKKRIAKNNEKEAADAKLEKNKTNGYSRKTTILFSLISRSAISLKNPVYTCESGGKIVIEIEVNNLGNVTKTSFNKGASTTTNGCLVESAISYAKQAQFSTSTKSSQAGSITYNFPGQN